MPGGLRYPVSDEKRREIKKIIETIHGVAIFLMFGGGLLADSLGKTPGGFAILFAIIGFAGALILLGNHQNTQFASQRN